MSVKFSQTLAFLVLSLFLSVAQAVEAPEFTLKDADGHEVSLSDYRGKALILHFWATWCPYCKALQPGLDKLYKKYQADGLELLAISWWEDEGVHPQKELQERGHSFLTLLNGDEVAKLYGVKGNPTTFYIDRNGQVLWVTNDSDPDNPDMEKAILKMLDSK